MKSYGLSFLGFFFIRLFGTKHLIFFFTGQMNKVIIYFDSFIGYVVVLSVVNFFDKHCIYDSFLHSTCMMFTIFLFLCKIKKKNLNSNL